MLCDWFKIKDGEFRYVRQPINSWIHVVLRNDHARSVLMSVLGNILRTQVVNNDVINCSLLTMAFFAVQV